MYNAAWINGTGQDGPAGRMEYKAKSVIFSHPTNSELVAFWLLIAWVIPSRHRGRWSDVRTSLSVIIEANAGQYDSSRGGRINCYGSWAAPSSQHCVHARKQKAWHSLRPRNWFSQETFPSGSAIVQPHKLHASRIGLIDTSYHRW